MPSISQKGVAMPPSPIRKLVPYAEAAIAKGRTIYHLNIGQPDIETPEVVMETMRNLDLNVVEYSHSAGLISYREGIADYYNKIGITLNPDSEILVTTGGSEALLMTYISCFDPGDEIIIPEPFYANYLGFAVAAGLKVVPVTCSIENGYALPPVEAFEEKITDKTKGILLCNPANPTGALYRKEALQALRDIVKKHDLFLIADEVYREFAYDGAEHVSCLQLEGLENNAILIDSVSKRYSMCGARIGVMISKNKQVMEAALKFAQARLSPPTFGQIASEAALQTPQSYFDEVIAEYVNRRNVLVEALNKIPGVVCPMPRGAFYAMASLPVDDIDKFCQWMLEEFHHENQTVMMAPASGFYATPGLGINEVRIAYVLDIDSLQKAVKCLEVGLEHYPSRK